MLCWLLGVSFGQACADYTKENPFLFVLLIVLGVAFVGVGGFILYLFIMGKKKASLQEETENAEGTETAQPVQTASQQEKAETAQPQPKAQAEEVKLGAKTEETATPADAVEEKTEVVEATETAEEKSEVIEATETTEANPQA